MEKAAAVCAGLMIQEAKACSASRRRPWEELTSGGSHILYHEVYGLSDPN